MPFATLQFNDYVFSDAGAPQFEVRTDYEAPGEGVPQMQRLTFTITQVFEEQSFADNEARIHELATALAAGEGRLRIKDEHSSAADAPALYDMVCRVKSHNVPKEWRQYVAEVTVVLEGRAALAATAGRLAATFTPTGGAAIPLPNVTDWKVGVRVQRFSNQAPNRDEAIETVTASGFLLADKTKTAAERVAALQSALDSLRGCNAKDGALAWGGTTKTVRVESLDGDLGDGTDRLNWSLAAFTKTFPDGDYAQPEYSVSQRNDYESGELIIAVRGKIKADAETSARNAYVAIKEQYATSGRELISEEPTDSRVGGIDGAAWIELSFSFEMREPLSTLSWQLRVSTREDARTADKTVVYEGKVAGKTAADALAKAASLGSGKLPFITSSNLVVSTRKSGGSDDERFVEVTFSYEYLSKSAWMFAEVTREVTGDPFSDAHETISGYAAADTLAHAETLANSFALSGRLQRDARKSYAERVMVNAGTSTRHAARVEFTFQYYLTPATVSLAFGRETSVDIPAMEQTVTFNGVARGPSETACNSAIDTLTAGTNWGKLVSTSRTASFEKQNGASTSGSAGAGAELLNVSFTARFTQPATGLAGVDILQAQVSMKTTYSVNKCAMTFIPFGQPFAQPQVGWTTGMRTVSGTCTARTQAGARTWGRAKKAMLGSGGYDESIEDGTDFQYAPLNDALVQKYTFNFNYAAKFAYLPYA